jgi:hypothetical protein
MNGEGAGRRFPPELRLGNAIVIFGPVAGRPRDGAAGKDDAVVIRET